MTGFDYGTVQVGTEASLGNIDLETLPVTYQAAEHLFSVAGQTPGQVSLARSNEWEWVVTHVNEVELKKPFPFCTSGVHRVYTIFGEPKAPWSNTYGSPQNAWVSALDVVCSNSWALGATTIEDAAGSITCAIYNSNRFEYDLVNGDCFYTQGSFYLTLWIRRINGYYGGGSLVNCWDCANGVVSLSNLLGCDLWNQWIGESFECNAISAIKDQPWGQPFGWGFRYHRMGWRGSENDTGKVFDACLKVTGGVIPVNMLFGLDTTPNGYKFLLVAPESYGTCSPNANPTSPDQIPRQRRDPIQ